MQKSTVEQRDSYSDRLSEGLCDLNPSDIALTGYELELYEEIESRIEKLISTINLLNEKTWVRS